MIINNEFHGMSYDINYSEHVFRLYDPKTCEQDDLALPCPYPNKIFDVIIRSRRILEKRNFDEICYAVDSLHEMNSIMLYGLPEEDCETRYSHDYIVPYFDYISTFDITQLEEFPDATWEEFFAVSALICVGVILESFDREDKTFEKTIGINDPIDWSYYAFETALNAAEAIAYAESLAHMSLNISKEVKDKISLRNRNAINIRHSTKNTIKDEFVEHYKNNSESSKAETARRFYKNLPDDKKKHFRDETCAIRSLLEHQRKLTK